jgi:hypothetical protein
MRIAMDYEVNKVQMDGEFKICPSCGYQDGFHSMFKKDKDITRWYFICPSCHAVFDIGLTAGSSPDQQSA